MELILAIDITNRLTRLNAELTRRNGYTNLSINVPIVATGGNPTSNTLAVATDINSIFSGLRLINSSGVPADRSALTSQMLESDLTTIDGKLAAFEATARYGGANDCAAACAGMCTTQCTTGCTGCKGCTNCTGCTNACTGCWTSCTGGCYGACTTLCARTCAGNCAGGGAA